jgi:hypothetical protein
MRQNEGFARIIMAFLSRFFSRAERAPLPSLEALLEAKGLSQDIPGLALLAADFEHLDAEERQAWVEALADLQAHGWPLPGPWIDAQYDLLPQLVPTWAAEREGFFYRPFIDGLSQRVIACGKVMPTTWLTLWGVTEHDVLERSLDQLREKSKNIPFRRLPSGIYQSAYQDGLDSVRLLLPELWCDLFDGQNTFVAIPVETTLLVAPQVLLPKLVDAVQRIIASDGKRIMATILQRVDGNLLPATMQDPHPIAQPQRELRQGDQLFAYRIQDQDLDPALGDLSEMGILHTQQGRAVSFAIWKAGKPVLLPDSDLVGFVDAQGKPLGLYVRQTLPRIGELRGTSVEIWGPRRLRFEGFPTAEQLDRLECFANAEQMAGIFKSAPPPPPQPTAASGAQSSVLSQATSPVPPHLRGQTLGAQNKD